MAPKVSENNNVSAHGDIDMVESLNDIKHATELFFRNQFKESLAYLEPTADSNFMHSTGVTTIKTSYAFFTMEKDLMEEAMQSIAKTDKLLSAVRKPSSISGAISGLFRKTDYNQYTDAEALAEWLHVSMRLYSVLMTVLSDQSMLSVLKSARNSMELNSALKLCHEIMEKKTNWEHDIYKINFNFAILLNWGLRNLLLSYLPARVIKLMTFFGIPGINRLEAVAALKRAMSDDLKSAAIYKLGPFGVCFASYYFEQMLGVGDLDYKWLTALTDEGLREYPDGSLDLYFTAKTHQLRGDTDRAIELFNRSIEVQNDFPAIHNVCRWDLLWCYAVKSEWSRAAQLADMLREECKWSPCTNTYQYACFMYMMMEDENRPELREKVDEAMKQVSDLRKRYVGKTLPPEKFAVTMAERYNNGETDLVLPAFTLFYIWNIYENSAETPEVLTPLLDRIDRKLKDDIPGESRYVLILLRGVCLRFMKRLEEAYDCFVEILNDEDSITKETYVPPHAAFELGMTYKAMGNFDEAKKWLTKARDSYTGFLVETIVHLRIHGALSKIKEAEKLAE